MITLVGIQLGLLDLFLKVYVPERARQSDPLRAAERYDSVINLLESGFYNLAQSFYIPTRPDSYTDNHHGSEVAEVHDRILLYTRKRDDCLKQFANLLPEGADARQWLESLEVK